MNTIKEIILLNVHNIIEKNRALYQKRLDLVNREYKKENEGMAPNIDTRGRLHAPCNGYRIPDRTLELCDFRSCYDEKLFRKGEFLPNPITDDLFFFFAGFSAKKNFKISDRIEGEELINMFKELKEKQSDFPFSISFSRQWQFKGKPCCYVNIESPWKSITTLFAEQLKIKHDEEKAIIEAAKAEEVAKKKASKGVAPVGRVQVKGTVTGFKAQESNFGTTWKMLVTLENGATVFGSIPSSISEIEKGDNVFFTATFEHDKNDETHAFFKRPSQASYESKQSV